MEFLVFLLTLFLELIPLIIIGAILYSINHIVGIAFVVICIAAVSGIVIYGLNKKKNGRR